MNYQNNIKKLLLFLCLYASAPLYSMQENNDNVKAVVTNLQESLTPEESARKQRLRRLLEANLANMEEDHNKMLAHKKRQNEKSKSLSNGYL